MLGSAANLQVQMAPCILPLSNVNLKTSNYAVQVMVIEKNIPRMSTSSNSQYQRIILQDKEVTHLKKINNDYLHTKKSIYYSFFICAKANRAICFPA